MGDRYYYSDRHKTFTPQNYEYSQSQQPLSNLFDMGPSQGGGFSVNTSTPTYNKGSSYNQRAQSGQNYNFQRTQHSLDDEKAYHNRRQYSDERLPPSYEDSRNDMLLSRSNLNFTQTTHKYSPAWDYIDDVGEEPQRQNRSVSNLFDIPGKKESPQNFLSWSNDRYSSSQNYQFESQGRLKPSGSFSQQPSSTFPSVYQDRFANRYKSLGNDSKQNYNKGSGIQNQKQKFNRGYNAQKRNRGRGGKGGRGFKGRGSRQDSGREDRAKDMDSESRKRCDEIEDQTKTNEYKNNSDPEGGKQFSEDHFDGRNEENRDEELFKQEEGNEDEGNEEDGNDDGEWEKGDIYCPDLSLLNKYQYYPPNPEEMGNMFKDLVIYFFFKIPKDKKERNPFVVICESFRRSHGYAGLQVEDGYDATCKERKFCTLTYLGMMMVRGVGHNNNLKEPRVVAGVELINKLAMSCYTLEAKSEYFGGKGFNELKEHGDVPGVYRFVQQSDAHDYNSALHYLKQLSSDKESDEEFIFKLSSNALIKLKNVAKQKGFEVRMIRHSQSIGIYHRRSAQYWRDKILASGSMENEKFVLKPPQGIGNLLISNFNIKEAVPGLRRQSIIDSPVENVYGPPGVGPIIRKALPPWSRRDGGPRTKKNKKKVDKIMELVKLGVPLQATKPYKYLSKKRKKNLRVMLGIS